METTLEPFELAAIEIDVYRAPIEQPVETAFGAMTNRPAVIVRAIERDGTIGFGEIWCNFPQCGAEHRARLATSAALPLIIDRSWKSPMDVFDHLNEKLRALAIQAGEPGPIAQVIAGIDTAVWDLAARRAGLPLFKLLGGESNDRLPAYASGINPSGCLDQAMRAEAEGYLAFKLKIGFGRERDLANLKALREHFGDDVPIMVDANQAWDLDEAIAMSRILAPFRPAWLEEPIPADSMIDDWRRLKNASPIPLAAGENLRGNAAFDEALAARVFSVVQPDLAKWGGISAGLPLAKRIMASGARYCPHYLGGGIGLVASAHLLAAAGGDGILEIDSNPNPLRTGLAAPFPGLHAGAFVLNDAPGLGVTPDPAVGRYAMTVPAA